MQAFKSILSALLLLGSLLAAQSYQYSYSFGTENFKHDNAVKAVAVSPDGKSLVSCDGMMLVFWNRSDGAKIKAVPILQYGGAAMQYSSDGKLIAVEDTC